MVKIINGKKYNTATATHIHGWGEQWGTFRKCEEDLYRSPRGQFFIHGSGGPSSKYAKRDGDGLWTNGEDIVVLTDGEARNWMETYAQSSLTCQYFDIEEG